MAEDLGQSPTLIYHEAKMNDLSYLTHQGLYDLLTGLRGPDLSHGHLLELKYLVTARLRSIVFSYNERMTGLFVDSLFIDEDLTRLQWNLALCTISDFHFLCHLNSAVYATKTHHVWGEFGPRVSQLLEDKVIALSTL